MKYEAPEIRVKTFKTENIVTTPSGVKGVQNELTSNNGNIKLDNQSTISEAKMFSFTW